MEKFKEIIYEGNPTGYLVSTKGRVFSVKTNQFMKFKLTEFGYLRVHLYITTINAPLGKARKKKRKDFAVHRLVANAFIPNPENKPQVNHIDGNKLNNKVSNLEWVTAQENVDHAEKNHLRDVNHSVTDEQIHLICKMLEEQKLNNKEIAEKVGCTPMLVSSIKQGRYYTRISSEYNIIKGESREFITEEDAEIICQCLEKKMKPKEISKKYGYNSGTISRIRMGRAFTRISSKYVIKTMMRWKQYKTAIDNLLLQGYTNKEIIKSLTIVLTKKEKNDFRTMVSDRKRQLRKIGLLKD